MVTPIVLAPGQPKSQSADETILDKRGIARRLNKSVRTIDVWMKRGRLPYIKVGRSVLFRWSAVLEKLESFRVN
jgi:excisionase family DNA binding protein